MSRAAFTLIEILATLLLLAFGLMSAVGMVQYASRVSADAQSQATAMATARTVTLNPEPVDLVADVDDANGDSWQADGPIAATPTGDYTFSVRGWLNGYYVVREERSVEADIISDGLRWATITVQVFAGAEEFVTTQRRLLRRTVAP